MTEDRSGALIAELANIPGDLVAQETAVALGAPPQNPLSAVPEVDAYYIDYSSDDVLRIYAVSAGRLLRHEHTRDRGYLTTVIALDRVRRVFEEGNAAILSLGIELEADQSTIRLVPVTPPALDGTPTTDAPTVFEGVVVHAGWVITATDPAVRPRLAEFGAQLRFLLAA